MRCFALLIVLLLTITGCGYSGRKGQNSDLDRPASAVERR